MIAKISHGWRAGGLLRYLMGPGRFNEHVDPRVLDTWEGIPTSQPVEVAPGEFDTTELATLLTDPARAAGVPQVAPKARPDGTVPRGPVWHCSLRNAADDRVLSDDEWREVVRDLLHRTGIAPRGDDGACRWVVVRHADDHVHVAAVLVREDNLKRVTPRNDFRRARETCVAAEERLGLTRTAAADRTAAPAPSRAETEKAARRGEAEPSRVGLRRVVRDAAVRSRDPQTFFAALESDGVLVRVRTAPDGRPVGYAVAVPGDRASGGEPVWYSGGGLAGDLSLPKLEARWGSAPAPAPPVPSEAGERATVGRAERTAALSDATSAAEHAAAQLVDGVADAEGIAHAASDLLSALGTVTAAARGPEGRELHARVRAAGEAYDRAARTPRSVLPDRWSDAARELRRSAWRLAGVRTLATEGSDGQAAAALALAIASLVAEIAALHAAHQRAAQASAARATAQRLTTRPLDTRPPSTSSARSQRRPPTARATPHQSTRSTPAPPAVDAQAASPPDRRRQGRSR